MHEQPVTRVTYRDMLGVGLPADLAHLAARHDGWLSQQLRVVLLARPEAVAA